jgi:hypothetical protein
MSEDDFPGIAPINFMQVSGKCKKFEGTTLPSPSTKKGADYLLPSSSPFCDEIAFADVALGWSREGILATVIVNQALMRTIYPEIQKGDSIEFFIDTRDVKTSGYNTRFCHHFYFLPEMIDGHNAGELTRFRTEDSHSHCDPSLLKVKMHKKRNSYELEIFIPSECLNGYDPNQFDRIGFTYRINRPDGPSQHFSVITEEYRHIEEQPSLWSSLRLVQ